MRLLLLLAIISYCSTSHASKLYIHKTSNGESIISNHPSDRPEDDEIIENKNVTSVTFYPDPNAKPLTIEEQMIQNYKAEYIYWVVHDKAGLEPEEPKKANRKVGFEPHLMLGVFSGSTPIAWQPEKIDSTYDSDAACMSKKQEWINFFKENSSVALRKDVTYPKNLTRKYLYTCSAIVLQNYQSLITPSIRKEIKKELGQYFETKRKIKEARMRGENITEDGMLIFPKKDTTSDY